MFKIDSANYNEYTEFARACKCGTVYPLSVAMNYQQGDIFVDSLADCGAALFWHYCGFACLSGNYGEEFLESVYGLLLDTRKNNSRRMVLFVDNEQLEVYFRAKDGIDIERRSFFELSDIDRHDAVGRVSNIELKEIDSQLLSTISGRITPRFSWDNMGDFLAKGKGYCVICDGNAAAWAFSSAVSDIEIDIGVETSEDYRHRGFAEIVSRAMVRYVLAEGKKPVWACHSGNLASAGLARKIGFKKHAECAVIKVR